MYSIQKRIVSAVLAVAWAFLPNQGIRAEDQLTPDPSPSALVDHSVRNVNLGSRRRHEIPAGFQEFDSAQLVVGRRVRTISPSDLLTSAELAALRQVLTSGQQTLMLGRHGNAVGGTVDLRAEVHSAVQDLVVPARVTAVYDFAGSAISLSGDFKNAGTLYAISSSYQSTGATIAAENIHNTSGAIISSVLPAGGVAGFTSVASHLDLNLVALQDIVNAGAIASSGKLSVIAGGSIVNSLPAGAVGSPPIMQAVSCVDLSAASIINSGVIASASNDVNIASRAMAAFTVTNTDGVIQALNGVINIRDERVAAKVDTSLVGGDWLSRELNLYSGNGRASVDVENLSGTLNVHASGLGLKAQTPDLSIGSLYITGDPVLINSGNIDISSLTPTNGAAYVIVAGGNITDSGATAINTSSSVGSGGNVILVAGANNVLTTSDGKNTVIKPNTGNHPGGSIQLSNTSATAPTINTQSTGGNGSGGNVTLVAFGGSGSNGTIRITNPNNGVSISTSGIGTGRNGDVTLVAGGTSSKSGPSGFTISVGGIVTGTSVNSGTGGGGDIWIETAPPKVGTTTTSETAVVISGSNSNQSGTGTVLNGGFFGDDPVDGAVSTGELVTAGGRVALFAGSNTFGSDAVSTGPIITTPNTGVGGEVNIVSGMASTFESGSKNINIGGGINTLGGNDAAGGSVMISAEDSFKSNDIRTGGGSVVVHAGSGDSAGTVHVRGIIDTGSAFNDGGHVMLVSMGDGQVGDPQFPLSIRTDSSSLGGRGGSIAVSSRSGTIAAESLSTRAADSNGGDGGDILLTSGGNSSSTVHVTGEMNTSTSNPASNAGQVWVITTLTPSQFSVDGGVIQNVDGVRQANPVSAVIPHADPTVPITSILFQPDYIAVGQIGSISGFSAGGFGSFLVTDDIDLQVSLVNTTSTVQHNTLIVPIVTGLLGLVGLEIPTSSNAGIPNVALFATGGIVIGSSVDGGTITTNGQGAFPFTAIVTHLDIGARLVNTVPGQPVNLGMVYTGRFLYENDGDISANGSAVVYRAGGANPGFYTLDTTKSAGNSIVLKGNVYATDIQLSTLDAAIDQPTGVLSSVNLSVSSGIAPTTLTSTSAAFLSLSSTSAPVSITNLRSVNVSSSGMMGALTITNTARDGLLTLGTDGLSSTGNVTLQSAVGTNGSISINGITAISNGAALNLLADGAGSVVVNSNIQSQGPIDITAGNVLMGPSSVVTSTGGDINVTTDALVIQGLMIAGPFKIAIQAGSHGLEVGGSPGGQIISGSLLSDAVIFRSVGSSLHFTPSFSSVVTNANLMIQTTTLVNDADIYASGGTHTLSIEPADLGSFSVSGNGSLRQAHPFSLAITSAEGQIIQFESGTQTVHNDLTITTTNLFMNGGGGINAQGNRLTVQSAGSSGLTVAASGGPVMMVPGSAFLSSDNSASDAIKFVTGAGQTLKWQTTTLTLSGNVSTTTTILDNQGTWNAEDHKLRFIGNGASGSLTLSSTGGTSVFTSTNGAIDAISFSAGLGTVTVNGFHTIDGMVGGNVAFEGANFINNGSVSATRVSVTPIGGSITVNGAGTLAGINGIFFSGGPGDTVAYSATMVLNNDTTFMAGTANVTGSVNVGPNRVSFMGVNSSVLTIQGNGSITSTSGLDDAIKIVTSGAGTVNFSTANLSINGNVKVETARLNNTGTLVTAGSLRVDALSGGGLEVSGTGTIGAGLLAASFRTGNGQTLTFSGAQTATSDVMLLSGTLDLTGSLNAGANTALVRSAGFLGLKIQGSGSIASTSSKSDAILLSVSGPAEPLTFRSITPTFNGKVTVQANFIGNDGTLAATGPSSTLIIKPFTDPSGSLTIGGTGSLNAGIGPITIAVDDARTVTIETGTQTVGTDMSVAAGSLIVTGALDVTGNKLTISAAGDAGLAVSGAGALKSSHAAPDAIKFVTTATQSLSWNEDVDIQGNLQIVTGSSTFVINASVSPTGSLQVVPVGGELAIAGTSGILDSGSGLVEILGTDTDTLTVGNNVNVTFLDDALIKAGTLTNNGSMSVLASHAELQVSIINNNGLIEVNNPSFEARLKLDPRAPINLNASGPAIIRALGAAGLTSIEFNPTDAAAVLVEGGPDNLVIESSGTVVFNGGTKAALISVHAKQVTGTISVMNNPITFGLKTSVGNLMFGTGIVTNGGGSNDGGAIDIRALGGTLVVNGIVDSGSSGANSQAGDITLMGNSATVGGVNATGGVGGVDGAVSITLMNGTLRLGPTIAGSVVIDGIATFIGPNGGNTSYTATSGALSIRRFAGVTFDSETPGVGTFFNFSAGGITGLEVSALGGAATVGTGTLVRGSGNITITACTFNNPNGFVAGQGADVKLNLSPLCNPANGCGTIANSNGNIILTKDLLINTNGLDLTIMASGSIVSHGAKIIDLSGRNGRGGNMNMFAGVSFGPAADGQVRDTSSLYEVFGASLTGGDIDLPDVKINTGTKFVNGDGGNVNVVAFAGETGTGSVSLGLIDTRSRSGNSGSVTIVGEGGVDISGHLLTGGGTSSGRVELVAAPPLRSASIFVLNGIVSGGFEPGCPLCGSGTTVSVAGKIDTSSKTGLAGSVTMQADRMVQVSRSIITRGLVSVDGSGSVQVLTNGGGFSVGESLNTSGYDIKSVGDDAAKAGSVTFVGTSFVHIGKDLLAAGGSSKGTGNGGSGGVVLLLDVPVAGPDNWATGSFVVGGHIDLTGGNSVGGDGGEGGALDAQVGRFAVSGGGVSVNASGGTGTTAGLDGQVAITTFSIQGLPTNFDLTSTDRSEVVLPGGMFSVGEKGGINGTRGPIVIGLSEAISLNAGRLVEGEHDFGNIHIDVVGGGVDIDVAGTPTTINPDDGNGIRSMVTPGQAFALYQVSRGEDQTIGLNAPGQVTDSNPSGKQSIIIIESTDFDPIVELLNVNLATVGANLVTMNVEGPGATLNLTGAKVINIAGTLDFVGPGAHAMLELGKQPLTVTPTGILEASDFGKITMNERTSTLTVTNNGSILASNIRINNNGRPVVVEMPVDGRLGGNVNEGGTTTFAVRGLTLSGGQLQETRILATMKGKPGDLNIETSFGTNTELGSIQGFNQIVVTSTGGSELKVNTSPTSPRRPG